MKVIISGGGIGGLAAAAALQKNGIEAVVLEQAPELKEIGAGLQLSANGMRVMRWLGVESEIKKCGVYSESFDSFDMATDEFLFGDTLGHAAEVKYGAPFYQLHRADLLNIIKSRVNPKSIHLNSRVVDYENRDDGVTVKLESGQQIEGDVLIGADGIHSMVRKRVNGTDDLTLHGLGWRAIIPTSRIEHLGFGHRSYIWLGERRSIIIYYLRGGDVLNFIGFVPTDEVHRKSWTESGDIEELQRSFADRTCDRVLQLTNYIESAFVTGIYTRPPLKFWNKGNVALLGDAAHPPQPYLAQGAVQAIEDAYTLAACLAKSDKRSIASVLEDYSKRRVPRTTKVQAYADAAERFFHEKDPVQIRARNGRFLGITKLDPTGSTKWGWLYSYDPIGAAEKPADFALGLAGAHRGTRLKRDASQHAFEMWMSSIAPEDVAKGFPGLRSGYERFICGNFPPPPKLPVKHMSAGGLPCIIVHPERMNKGPVILHLHGGGFIMGSAKASIELASRLADQVQGACVIPDYRLAPEHPFPAAHEDVLSAYRWLIEDQNVSAKKVIVTGESAGGALAVSLVSWARQNNLPDPSAIFAMSPFADMTLTGPSLDEREGEDPVVNRALLTDMAGCYLQGHDARDPMVSPIFADLKGFPPLLIHVGENEALFDDAWRLAERAKAAGVEATLEAYPDTVHTFHQFNFLSEAKTGLSSFARFAEKAMLQAAR